MQKKVYLVLSFLLIWFVVFRAIYVPLVHDEIATFYYYIQSFEYNPFLGAHADANNHILNSLLSSISYNLFGYSSFTLRLPNVLSFLLYLTVIWKIAQFFSQNLIRWMYILASLGMLYFIQFFSLSRGYGLSMAFMLTAFYFLLQLYKITSLKYLFFFAVALLLALLANLTLIPIGVLLLFTAIYLSLRKRNNTVNKGFIRFKTLLIYFVLSLSIAVLVFLSFRMKAEGALYYGNSKGFWTNTILSLLDLLFENDALLPQIILVVCFSLFVLLIFVVLKKQRISFFTGENGLFTFAVFGALTSIFLMHYLLGVNYPVDRVGLFLIPLFVGAFLFLLDQFTSAYRNIAFIALIFPIHFLIQANITHTSIWKNEYIPDTFFYRIQKDQSEDNYPATISGDALRIFNYNEKLYRNDGCGNALQFWTRDQFNTNNWTIKTKEHPAKYFDFIIAEKKWMHSILHLYDALSIAPRSNHILYKRKELPEKQKFSENYVEQASETTAEFNELIKLEIDSLGVSTLLVGMDLTMQSQEHPFKGRLVAQVKNRETNEVIRYEYIQLNWITKTILKEKPLRKTLLLSNLPSTEKLEVLVYIWNIERKNYTLYTSKLELFKVKDKNE